MDWNILFFLNSALLGVGLAMDAFSVSIVSGLNESNMKKSKAMEIAGVFAFFQALMPMLGWMLVSFLAEKFTAFQIYIPWVAFALLAFWAENDNRIPQKEERRRSKQKNRSRLRNIVSSRRSYLYRRPIRRFYCRTIPAYNGIGLRTDYSGDNFHNLSVRRTTR